MAKGERDIEQIYSTEEVVAKLRRLADALETGESFRIQIAGERFRVPARAECTHSLFFCPLSTLLEPFAKRSNPIASISASQHLSMSASCSC